MRHTVQKGLLPTLKPAEAGGGVVQTWSTTCPHVLIHPIISHREVESCDLCIMCPRAAAAECLSACHQNSPTAPVCGDQKAARLYIHEEAPPRQQLAGWNTGDGDFLPLRNFQFYSFKDGAGRLCVCWRKGEFIASM